MQVLEDENEGLFKTLTEEQPLERVKCAPSPNLRVYVYLVNVRQRIDTSPAFNVYLLTPGSGSSPSLTTCCALIPTGSINNAEA
jgi:hypothetical protein